MLKFSKHFLFLIISISIFLVLEANISLAAETELNGYVYELDESYLQQNPLDKVSVKVYGKGNQLIAKSESGNDGHYSIKTNSSNDPLSFVYYRNDCLPYPKRVVPNDLKNKNLDSVALVKKASNPADYKPQELVHISQSILEVMLIYNPDKDLINIAIFLSGNLLEVDSEKIKKAVDIDPSTYYNIGRLLQTTKWMKPDFFNRYLAIFKSRYGQ